MGIKVIACLNLPENSHFRITFAGNTLVNKWSFKMPKDLHANHLQNKCRIKILNVGKNIKLCIDLEDFWHTNLTKIACLVIFNGKRVLLLSKLCQNHMSLLSFLQLRNPKLSQGKTSGDYFRAKWSPKLQFAIPFIFLAQNDMAKTYLVQF